MLNLYSSNARASAKCVPTQGVGTRQILKILIQTIKAKLKYRIWANASGARPEMSMLQGTPTSGSLAGGLNPDHRRSHDPDHGRNLGHNRVRISNLYRIVNPG